MLSNDLYNDSLTGCDNYYSFMQSDFKKIFGSKGIVFVIDIANFLNFNNKFGTSIGDLYLKCLSDSIRKILSDNPQVFIFRTHGDDFTCIFPNGDYSYVENASKLIEEECKKAMDSHGFHETNLHKLILSYDHEVNSIEEYYELMVKNQDNQSKETEFKFSNEKLLRHIFAGITNRVRDTLSNYEEAYNLALIDDVSGLSNHRAGRAYLKDLLEKHQTSSIEFSVLFIDGDNLKRYNQISYNAGNEIIKKLGQIITNSIHDDGKVYRWLSGDEFLVVLPGADETIALKLADKIRVSVQEQTKELIHPTTISVGLACYPNDASDVDDIINKAERANAMAKVLGKNRVIKWSET